MASTLNGWYYDVSSSYDRLTQAELQSNAEAFYNYFASTMTLEAVCGILGNIQVESQLNPGQMEGGYGGSLSGGYGLIQWTPGSILTNWASSNGYSWYDAVGQCYLINAECYNNVYDSGVWQNRNGYNYTWDAFKQLTNVEEAAKAYLYQRERPLDPSATIQQRINYANQWYTHLSGYTPQPSFTPRLSLPPIAELPHWYTAPENWYMANGYGPPAVGDGNCTWYAYGRYAEARGSWPDPHLSWNSAGRWYDEATAFSRGSTPQLGAVICMHDPTGERAGHVAVVEEINADGSITVSQSGYPNLYFNTATLYEADGYSEYGYTVQGFIYNDISPTPPEPPVPPEPEKKKKMPLWMMLKYF